MKNIIWIFCMFVYSGFAQAQNWGEWIRQNATQRDYLIEQIAHLKLYLKLTEKGYEIAKDGLTLIGNIKRGEFNLHKNFFDSLLIVNPKITGLMQVKNTPGLHENIRSTARQTLQRLGAGGQISTDEMAYIRQVFDRVIADCDLAADAMVSVFRSQVLSMSDDERIKRIDRLYRQLLSNYEFVKTFSAQAVLLAVSRAKEQEDISTIRALYGIE